MDSLEKKKYEAALELQEEMLEEALLYIERVLPPGVIHQVTGRQPNMGQRPNGWGGVEHSAGNDSVQKGPFDLIKRYGKLRLKEIFEETAL